jgi:hypothetical protein
MQQTDMEVAMHRTRRILYSRYLPSSKVPELHAAKPLA